MRVRLLEFALARSIDSAQSLHKDLPRWIDKHDEPIGFWCQSVHICPNIVSKSLDVIDWQEIVEQLKQRTHFNDRPYFYYVEGLYEVGTDKSAQFGRDGFTLKPDTRYEVRIVHFSPKVQEHRDDRSKTRYWMYLQVDGQILINISSSYISIDSPYDVKYITLKTSSSPSEQHSRIFLHASRQETEHFLIEDSAPQFELPITVRGRLASSIILGVTIGLLLSSQQLVDVYSRENADAWQLLPLTVSIGILGLLTGLVAVFGLRRPF